MNIAVLVHALMMLLLVAVQGNEPEVHTDTQGLERLKNYAIFYPHLGVAVPARLNTIPVNFTTDSGTVSFERRHMIDVHFLLSLHGGKDLLDAMVEPVPYCNRISGLNMEGQKVLGMLNQPLELEYKFIRYHPGQTLRVLLNQVLVIDRLPVPLHVSGKRLMASDGTGLAAEFATDALGRPISLKKSSFPAEFHDHPYWHPEKMTAFIGKTVHDDVLIERLKKSAIADELTLVNAPVCSDAEEGVCISIN